MTAVTRPDLTDILESWTQQLENKPYFQSYSDYLQSGSYIDVDNLLLGQSFIHSRAAFLQQSIESQPLTQEFEKEKKKIDK